MRRNLGSSGNKGEPLGKTQAACKRTRSADDKRNCDRRKDGNNRGARS